MPTSYRTGAAQAFATGTCCCTGTGTGTGTFIDQCCCPGDPLPDTLLATITGCDGGSYALEYSPTNIWNSGPGQICAGIGMTSVLLTFVCDSPLAPDPCVFSIFLNDAAQGPFQGTLVSCDPFIWISDPINLDAFGCTCGDFTVTVTG